MEEKAMREDMVEALLAAYKPLVYAVARQLCPRTPQDEDLLQCGMIGLWRAAERWDMERPFGPLARHCVRSEMVDHLRRTRSQPETLSLEAVDREGVYTEDWDGVLLRQAAMDSFPEGSRERALLLAICDGVGLSQAAKGLGLRRGRARRLVRQAVREKDLL